MNLLLNRKVSIAAALILLCAGALVLWHFLADPRVIFLRSQEGADWIRADQPFDPQKFDFDTSTAFETSADFGSQTTLKISALRRVVVICDGAVLFDSGSNLDQWKRVYPVPISAGPHRLRFVVSNQRGPSLLRVSGGIRSDPTWRASSDGWSWSAAVLASDLPVPRLPQRFGSTWNDFLRLSPWWGGLFAVSAIFCFARSLRGSTVRWILLIGWVVMAFNNIMKVPLQFGYDADSHYLYIDYVAHHLSIPRPDAGWQYFQSPLYYVLSALLYRVLILLGVAGRVVPYLLRLIPLACGATIIEFCYRASRRVFPGRGDLQAIATLVGGLLPVNIYMSQAVSNEPLAAVASGWITLICLRLLSKNRLIRSNDLLWAGAALGVGFLIKINILIWIVPVGAALATALFRNRAPTGLWIKSFTTVAGGALCISGGLFARNLVLIHRPFYLESTVAHDQWWQDPGYRTPQMFYEFGHVFARPIYNGLFSVWDSLYGTLWGNGIPTGQPPWNYGLMSCGLWLALVPMAAIVIGLGKAAFEKNAQLRFAALSVICFIAAVIYVYLTLPIYSCAKASYLLGTAPCLGLLAAAGIDRIMVNRWAQAIASGAILCWAITAYLTYFAVS